MRNPVCLLLLFLFCSCTQFGELQYVSPLPRSLNESSGMVSYDGKTIWVIEDGGNPERIREVDTLGNLISEFEVKNARNRDWEALTRDPAGNLYIGDFGNNRNDREDLAVFRLPDPRIEKGDAIEADAIRFRYPDQREFPPERDRYFFDAEALFHHNGNLYVITKNRARPFNGKATVYRVPDQPGEYLAERVADLDICMDRRTCQVTDAALSPDGNRLVLLGYGYLWVFDNFGINGFKGVPRRIALRTNTQLEGVCFASDSLLYLTDEKSLGRGGNLYAFPLPRL